MSYPTPDIDIISLNTDAALRSAMQRDPALPRSMLRVISKALAGAADGLYEKIDGVAKDIIYTTARQAALIRWAGIWKLQQKAPSAASAVVQFSTGTGTVQQGALLARNDGLQYQVDADAILNDGGMATITCLSAGAMTTLEDGALLTMAQPLAGVPSSATVTAYNLTPGNDMETPQALLVRLLNRIRQTPQGGADADYIDWALSVPGVTRAWPMSWWNGPGTVGVLFMCDDRPNPIPLAGDVAAVQAAIDAVRPTGSRTFVVAPTPAPLDFTIALSPDSADLRTAVQQELANLIATECEADGHTLPITHIWAAIQSAIGTGTFTMPSPSAPVTTPPGTITTMGAITW